MFKASRIAQENNYPEQCIKNEIPQEIASILKQLQGFEEAKNNTLEELQKIENDDLNANREAKKPKKETIKSMPSAGGGDPEDPNDPDRFNKNNKQNKNDLDNDKCPNGKYKDANYHHQNSTGNNKNGKSPAPKNGQTALDNSIQIKTTSPRRVGISEGEIVILDRTSKGLTEAQDIYHGHVRTWDQLEEDAQKALESAGLVKNGKIIKK